MTLQRNLQRLLQPRSVAIVGASPEKGKVSGMLFDFLLRSGFTGRVHAVNPRYQDIDGVACYPSVEALPETVDVLVCAVPVAVAFDAIEAAARRGVPFCLLMTGGFGEGRSGEPGNDRRRRLLELCRETGMHVVGPNTVGMVSFRQRMPLTFADWYGRDTGLRGGVAIVTHSGSVGGLIFSSLQINGIGVDYWIGLGNEATLEAADFIAHFSDDPAIHTVVCYVEGVQDGRNFMAAAAKARQAGKRVVVLKAGDEPESVRSTLAHTGKHPTSGDVYAGVFRQLGVIQVASLAELAYAMILLTRLGAKIGPRVGIISASGGANSLIADHIAKAGLELPLLPEALQRSLNAAIPEYGSSLNPLDLSADVVARAAILHETLKHIATDDSIDIWVVFGRPVIDRYHDALAKFAGSVGKAVIACSGVPLAPEIQSALEKGGVAVLPDPELCMRALGSIRRASFTPGEPQDYAGFKQRMGEVVADAAGTATATLAGELETSSGLAPVLRVSIEEDCDFGTALVLNAVPAFGKAKRRVVRVLPATDADLRDAVQELAELEGGLPAGADAIVNALAALTRAYARHPRSAGLKAELSADASGVRLCGAPAAARG